VLQRFMGEEREGENEEGPLDQTSWGADLTGDAENRELRCQLLK
jgi:hypothetical protein